MLSTIYVDKEEKMANEIAEKNMALKKLMLSLANKKAWEYSIMLTEKSLETLDREMLKSREHVFFIGQGTSYATALCASSWGAHIAKLNSRAITAYEFRQYLEDILLCPGRSLVVGISCGGETESVRLALLKAREAGATTMIISGEGDIKCAEPADFRLITDSHIESRSGTKAASVSHIFLMSAAYKLSVLIGSLNGALTESQTEYWNKGFDEMVESMKCLPWLFDRMNELAMDFAQRGYDNFAVLGAGPNFGTAQEAALKTCEFAWKFCACEELEDFQHGRFREVNDNVAILITAPSGRNDDKTEEILNICSKAELGAFVLTDKVTDKIRELALDVVQMPTLPDEYLTPFLYIFPYWFFGYHIMENAGGKVGESRYVYRGGFIGRPENLPK